MASGVGNRRQSGFLRQMLAYPGRLMDRLALYLSKLTPELARTELTAAVRLQLDDIARARTRRQRFPQPFEGQFQSYVRAVMRTARTIVVLITLLSFLTAPLWSPQVLKLPESSLPLTWLVCYFVVTPVFLVAAWLQILHADSRLTEAWLMFAFLVEVAALELMIYGTDASGFRINASMAVTVPVAVLPICRFRISWALAFGALYFFIVFTRELLWPGVLNARAQTDWMLEIVLVTAAVASVAFSRLSLRRGWAANVLLDSLASTDAMTGLPNRAAFEEHYQRFAQLSQRRRVRSLLALIDLDHFKKVNDRYGHQYGDGVLVEFSLVLAEFARRTGDMAARLGGEEFGLFLFECDATQGQARLREFLESLRGLGIEHEDSALKVVTASVGAVAISGRESMAESYHTADKCLYEAKQAGRNCVRLAAVQ